MPYSETEIALNLYLDDKIIVFDDLEVEINRY